MDDEILDQIINAIDRGDYDEKLPIEFGKILINLKESPKGQPPTHEQIIRFCTAVLERMKKKGYYI
jgi:hypothetical protein